MTTGSWTTGSLYPGPHTGFNIGGQSTKSWSGADRPKVVQPTTPAFTVTIDGKIHKFKKLRTGVSRPPKRAREPDNAYTMSYTHLSDEEVYWSIPYVPGLGGGFSVWVAVRHDFGVAAWSATALLDANDEIKLANKIIEQTRGSDFNMSVFLGEGHQVLRMIGDSAVKIRKSLWYLRRGDFGAATRSLTGKSGRAPVGSGNTRNWGKDPERDLANNWLELQYGWLPLLKDVKAGAEMLAHQLSVPAQVTFRASVRKETTSVRNDYPGWWNIQDVARKSHRRSVIARISEGESTFAQLGLLDPELVAWELMPYSFVVDWFIPIGSWMEARAASRRLKGTFVYSDKRTAIAGPVVGPGITSSATYAQVLFDRSISSSLQVPLPVVKPLDKIASWQHCANAIALLTQVATRKHP